MTYTNLIRINFGTTMKTQKDIPYGVSDFRTIMQEKLYYVDRTNYIKKMESGNNKFLFFLRPRRFGKSLLISTLNYYYGIQYKAEFESLFGELYAGKNPTENRNGYYVMNFDFTSINTTNIEDVMEGFNDKIKFGLIEFNKHYKLLEKSEFDEVLKNVYPSSTLGYYLTEVSDKLEHKIMVLIDEYDHFTNEILSFNFTSFADIVSKNGFVRKFYETIKLYTGKGVIDRFFATGVTPVTLDSMTSGFNIATNISGKDAFNEMAGFTDAEVKQMLYDLFPGIADSTADTIMKDAAAWYNGSLFSAKAATKLYNPAMLLRFISEINPGTMEYPRQMVDKNIISDFSKIKNLAKLQNYDKNIDAIRTILEIGSFPAELTEIYSFERDFTVDDFISLLYYNGLLTIKEPLDFELSFEIPNYVIKVVYWSFFAKTLSDDFDVKTQTEEIKNAIRAMANNNDAVPLIKIIENILAKLSNRDLMKFDEKYIKMIFMVYVSITNSYFIKSEAEMDKKYPDLLFLHRNQYRPKYQHLFELKYIKKENAGKLDEVRAAGIEQVKGYLASEEIKAISGLRAWLIIFTGDVCSECKEIAL